MSFKLSRRTLLRGALGACVASLALPALEVFVDDHGTAWASGEAFPKRFVLWFWGNGIGAKPGNWIPTGTGSTWSLSPILKPLEPIKQHVTVVSGLKVFTPNLHPHGTGPACVLAGGRSRQKGFPGPTLDQLIADRIGGDTLQLHGIAGREHYVTTACRMPVHERLADSRRSPGNEHALAPRFIPHALSLAHRPTRAHPTTI